MNIGKEIMRRALAGETLSVHDRDAFDDWKIDQSSDDILDALIEMADFHLAQSSEITADWDRLREWLGGLLDVGWRDGGKWMSVRSFEDGSHAVVRHGEIISQGETVYEALTAYLTGKGDGDKGE